MTNCRRWAQAEECTEFGLCGGWHDIFHDGRDGYYSAVPAWPGVYFGKVDVGSGAAAGAAFIVEACVGMG